MSCSAEVCQNCLKCKLKVFCSVKLNMRNGCQLQDVACVLKGT